MKPVDGAARHKARAFAVSIGRQPMTDRLRFAVIGASGHASKVVAPTLARSATSELKGVLGSSLTSGAAFAERHGIRAFSELDELLNDREVDAVWIASPNHLHAVHAVACAQAGKHLLIEKPLAPAFADASRVLHAVRASGVHARVGYQHRFRGAHLRVRSLVLGGTLGLVGVIRLHRYWRFPYFEDQTDDALPSRWRQSRDSSGGWVTADIVAHLVDLVMWLTGKPVEAVTGAVGSLRFRIDSEDTAVLVLDLGGDCIASIEASVALRSPGSVLEIYGSDGWLRAENSFDILATLRRTDSELEEYAEPDWIQPYVSLVDDFVSGLRGGHSNAATLDEAVANVAALEEFRTTAVWLQRSPM